MEKKTYGRQEESSRSSDGIDVGHDLEHTFEHGFSLLMLPLNSIGASQSQHGDTMLVIALTYRDFERFRTFSISVACNQNNFVFLARLPHFRIRSILRKVKIREGDDLANQVLPQLVPKCHQTV